jgi:hypothetical protein
MSPRELADSGPGLIEVKKNTKKIINWSIKNSSWLSNYDKTWV